MTPPEAPPPTARLDALERNLRTLSEVCAALADDNLRLVGVLTELVAVGVLPAVPWNLAALHVELHHLAYARARGEVPADGVPLEETEAALRRRIVELRAQYVAGLPPELPYSARALDRVQDDSTPPKTRPPV